MLALEHRPLLTQGEVFKQQRLTRAKETFP
jgi:hypothetical protein